ncbi:ankyrin [Hyaloscypha variabilis]
MAPKSCAIPVEEWERHKEAIKGLFAQKPLAEVIQEMKRKYNFEASKSQYEAKLRLWGFRKNWKREQWQILLNQHNDIPETGLITSSGRMKTQPSIQRSLRRLKKIPGVALGQASRESALSHPLSRMANSSNGPLVEQVSQAALGPGVPRQQEQDVARLPGFDGASSSPESALLRLGEASAQFDLAELAGPFSSEFDDPMLFRWNLASNSHMDCDRQTTAFFDAGGHDMLGIDLNSSLESNWQIRATTTASPFGISLTRRASPINQSQSFLDADHSFGINLQQTQIENLVFPPAAIMSSPGDLGRIFNNTQLPSQNGTFENGIFDLWYPNPVDDQVMLPAGSTKQWLESLPFAKFENYLRSQNIIFNDSESSTQQRPGASLFGSFALRSVENSLYSGSLAVVQRLHDSPSLFQTLGRLLPGESTAVITKQQITETRLFKLLLFSMMNGFVGLHQIPREDILKAMGHFSTSKLLLQILEKGPPYTSRTLADNMFRTAIEAKDERVVKLLLERELVDVNDTVCFFGNRRYTPVERAASLLALGLVRILVEAKADVNKMHESGRDGGGALAELMGASCPPHYLGPVSRPAVATPGVIGTLDFLIHKGSHVNLGLLSSLMAASRYKNNEEVVCLISRSIPPTQHQAFFELEEEGDDDEDDYSSLAIDVAMSTDDITATTVFQNILEICERSGCSKCLERWPKGLEWAAVAGAERGHFKLVQLLIGHVPSTTRILSAAISSRSKKLIRLVLNSDPKPELDPPAHSIKRRNSIDDSPTTPLAEAVRTKNADLVKTLEMAGALDNLAEGNRLKALVLAAAEAGNMHYMEFLLERASSSSHKYRTRWRAVQLALENDHDAVAKLLLSAGAEFISSAGGLYSDTLALRAALRKRDPDFVQSLLSADIGDINSYEIPNDVASWFNTSILSDLVFVFPELLSRLSVPPPPQPGQLPPYHSAVENICMQCIETDNLEFFKTLLECSSITSAFPWNSCLASAVRMGHGEMVDLLLQNGANPFDNEVLRAALPDRTDMLRLLLGGDRKQGRGRKCVGAQILKFVMAEHPGNAGVLGSLLDNGLVNFIVAEDALNDLNRYHLPQILTPLGLAIVGLSGYCTPNLWAVDRLLQAGSDPNGVARIKDFDIRVGQTALMLALETEREDIVRLLVVEYKADVNKKTHLFIKRTPLQYAAELGNLEMVRLLLELGAVVNGEPAIRSGGTALQFAAISGNCNMVAELLEKGAQLHALPSKVNGRWPLEGAAEHGRLDMIQFLWRAKELSLNNAGFQERQCLRAMDFARSNGHLGCMDLIADLSRISVNKLKSDDYGVPWLAY